MTVCGVLSHAEILAVNSASVAPALSHLGSDSGDDSCRRAGTASGTAFMGGLAEAAAAAGAAAGGAAAGGDMTSPPSAPTSPSSSSPDSFSEGSGVGSLAGIGEGERRLRLGLLLLFKLLLRGLHCEDCLGTLNILQPCIPLPLTGRP